MLRKSNDSLAEVLWHNGSMSTEYPRERGPIGDILIRLLHHFRTELFGARDRDGRFTDIRWPHMPIWANVGEDGIRLTRLAHLGNLGLPACSELVNELEQVGYLERRPDPADRRAKLIFPTDKGRELLATVGGAVNEMEERWRRTVPDTTFDAALETLNALLFELDRLAAQPEPGSE